MAAARKRAPAKPCLGCGKKTRRPSSRCLDCERGKTAERKAEGKRTGSTRAWRKLRETILERDGHRCVFVDKNGYRCKATTDLHVDHVKPLADGGTDDPSNLQTLCSTHNLRKGARSASRSVPRPAATTKTSTYRCARCGTTPVRRPGVRCSACVPTSLAQSSTYNRKQKGRR